MTHILVVEPNPGHRKQLCELLESNGYAVDQAERYPHSIANRFRAIVANAGSRTGLALPPDCNVPVILIADKASIRAAVDAIREGAADYLPRSFAPGDLLGSLERITSPDTDGTSQPPRYDTWLLQGSCPAMRELFEQIEVVAPSESTVLIEGEPGTGKELVARALHASGQRRHAPLISLNCAATPPVAHRVGTLRPRPFQRAGGRTPSNRRWRHAVSQGSRRVAALDTRPPYPLFR